jgi:hypothetical protein
MALGEMGSKGAGRASLSPLLEAGSLREAALSAHNLLRIWIIMILLINK